MIMASMPFRSLGSLETLFALLASQSKQPTRHSLLSSNPLSPLGLASQSTGVAGLTIGVGEGYIKKKDDELKKPTIHSILHTSLSESSYYTFNNLCCFNPEILARVDCLLCRSYKYKSLIASTSTAALTKWLQHTECTNRERGPGLITFTPSGEGEE